MPDRKGWKGAKRQTAARRFLTRLLFVLSALVIGFCAFQRDGFSRVATFVEQDNDNLKDPKVISEGARLFATSCGNAYCHGTGGAGGGAPRVRGRDLEAKYVFKSIVNGIPGSAMPSFKSELSEQQIWSVVAFVTSDSKTTPIAEPSKASPPVSSANKPVELPAASSTLIGNPQAGRAIFFDSSKPKSCHACHSINGEGTPIGPDLSGMSSRTARDLVLSVIVPRQVADKRFETVTITLRSGEKVTGVKKDDDSEAIRVYDTTELPAVLRTIQKTDLVKVESSQDSVMPKDYASQYTVNQLLDLISFLKSSLQDKRSVTLRDLFDK
jgi:putative heme-binding domain-containing protein